MKDLKSLATVFVLLMVGSNLCSGSYCVDSAGATYVDCENSLSVTDLTCCNRYQYTGPMPQTYELLGGNVELVITSLTLAAGQTVTIKSFQCDGGCKHLVIDANLPLPFTVTISKGRFTIKGSDVNTSMKFLVDGPSCSCKDPCKNIYLQNLENPVSGEYNVNVYDATYKVFCEFKANGEGCVYISKESLIQHNTIMNLQDFHNDNSKACLKFKRGGGQKDNIIEQISEFNNIPLSFHVNSHPAHQLQSHANIVTVPYLFLGLIPQNLISKHVVQGYKHNGNRYAFSNCDNNPNSYFAFTTGTLTGTQVTGSRPWIASGTDAVVNLPDDYFYYCEEHQGGCGVYFHKSWVSLGLPFNY